MNLEIINKGPQRTILYGIEASGGLHIGHYLILKELKRLSKNPDLKVIVYISDLHAKLNNKPNVEHYTKKLTEFFTSFAPEIHLKYSPDIIKDPKYIELFFSFMNKCTLNRLLKGLPDDLKQKVFKTSPTLEDETFEISVRGDVEADYVLYPALQAIDSEYFKADCVYFGCDQRKIYMLAYKIFESLGWDKPSLYSYPLINNEGRIDKFQSKMSSSKNESLFLDKLLYSTLEKYKTLVPSDQFTQKQLYILRKLKNYTDEKVLELYRSVDNEAFLNQLLEDLIPFKDFTFAV